MSLIPPQTSAVRRSPLTELGAVMNQHYTNADCRRCWIMFEFVKSNQLMSMFLLWPNLPEFTHPLIGCHFFAWYTTTCCAIHIRNEGALINNSQLLMSNVWGHTKNVGKWGKCINLAGCLRWHQKMMPRSRCWFSAIQLVRMWISFPRLTSAATLQFISRIVTEYALK